MIRRLPFQPTSCYHDFRYYSVFYGEAFLFDEFIYYFDGRDLRVTGYDLQGHSIRSAALADIIRAAENHARVRTVTAECPRPVSLARRGLSFTREILAYPSPQYGYEMILNHGAAESKTVRKSVRRAQKNGLTTVSPITRDLTHQHYLLIDRFVRRFEPSPFFGAEFVASIYHLLSRKLTLFLNCYNGQRIVGFTLATVLRSLGISHMTISAGDESGVSDLLYHHMIRSLRQRGARRISFGFSLNKGLFNFKRKWGAEPTWAGGYEILWYRDGASRIPQSLWATRIARRG